MGRNEAEEICEVICAGRLDLVLKCNGAASSNGCVDLNARKEVVEKDGAERVNGVVVVDFFAIAILVASDANCCGAAVVVKVAAANCCGMEIGANAERAAVVVVDFLVAILRLLVLVTRFAAFAFGCCCFLLVVFLSCLFILWGGGDDGERGGRKVVGRIVREMVGRMVG